MHTYVQAYGLLSRLFVYKFVSGRKFENLKLPTPENFRQTIVVKIL